MATRKALTLLFVRNNFNEILLGLKKRGFGEGKWNGFGGKVNPTETITDAAIRELQEESGLLVKSSNLIKFAVIEFEFVGDPVILEVHAFQTHSFEGEPIETEEMLPQWYKLHEIPFDKMWVDDKIWFPMFLSGKTFRGYFLFQGHSNILKYTLNEVERL